MITPLNLRVIGKGPPLVMLHGWGWHSGIWQPLVPYLAEKFQLFLVDLPGFGQSPLLSPHYSITEITNLLLAITPPHSIWLGWSLGGMIAWHIAIHHPERVSQLITVASSPKFMSTPDWPGVAPHTIEKFANSLVQNYQITLEEFLELQLRGSPKNQVLLTELRKQITTSSHTTPALLGSLGLLRDMDLRAELTKMQCPSLHLFGSHDTLVPVKVAKLIQPALLHGKCAIIKRAGHIPFLSQMKLFLDYLLLN